MKFIYDESQMPMDASPNEIGSLMFELDGQTHRGLIIVSESLEIDPVGITLIPDEIADDFEFTVTLSPYMAHFLGALQAKEQGKEVPEEMLVAGRIMWWLINEFGQLKWKELLDD